MTRPRRVIAELLPRALSVVCLSCCRVIAGTVPLPDCQRTIAASIHAGVRGIDAFWRHCQIVAALCRVKFGNLWGGIETPTLPFCRERNCDEAG